MAYDFPNAPTIGQSYQGYTWDGEKWLKTTVSATTAWNPADLNNVTLSNGNLTAATTSASNPGCRGVVGLLTGKRYWEATMTDWSGGSAGIGLATASAGFGSLAAGQVMATKAGGGTNGSIYVNGSSSGSALGARANGDTIGIAVDLSARLIWFRVAPAGNWNGSGTANPATGIGGLGIGSLTGSLYPYYGAASVQSGITANFGATAFSGAVPSGFTSGWSADPLAGTIRYDTAQPLTANQQAQARSNTGVTKRNYIINGGMQISQENGTTAGGSNGYFAVDQFQYSNASALVASVAQVASVTPAGSPNRLRVTVTTADASVAAGDFVIITQALEGSRLADLRSGSTAAKTVIVQFGVKAPAGTYCVAFRNYAGNRSYIAEYVVAAGEANTDVVKSVSFQLDQTGTWASDNNGLGMLSWGLMCGTTYQTAAGSWAAGNFLGSANQYNFAGISTPPNNVFELFDVGLYEGNVAPPFAVPDFASELALCQRYFTKSHDYLTAPIPNNGYAGCLVVTTSATSSFFGNYNFQVEMRGVPTVTTLNPVVANANWYDANNSAERPVSGLVVGTKSVRLTGTGGIVNGCNSIHIKASARL